MGWFQVLPVGQKSSQPYQFNMLHVLPGNKMPVKKLPIQTFIDTKSSYMRKKDKTNNVQAQQRYQTQKEEQESLA